LFGGKPWHYLVSHSKDYVFDFQKESSSVQSPYGKAVTAISFERGAELGARVLEIFKTAAERINRSDRKLTQTCFQELLLKIIVNQQ